MAFVECYLIAFFVMQTYSIIRFYAPHLNKSSRVIYCGLTLEQAQEHCNDPETRISGEWFDGYNVENPEDHRLMMLSRERG